MYGVAALLILIGGFLYYPAGTPGVFGAETGSFQKESSVEVKPRGIKKLFRFFEFFAADQVYTPGATAQTSSELPDLTITKATLDGAALRFRYHNRGKGDAAPKVSFWYEWVDGQGFRIGEVYWINVGGMGASSTEYGYQVHDFTRLVSEYGQVKLADLIYSPPPGAYHLKFTIDGPNNHAESNEQNNSVLLPVLRPDFTITDAKFGNDFLSFRHHNRGNRGHREGQKISFWFEWVDARGARVGDLYWFDTTPPGLSLPLLAELDSRTTLYSASGATSFTSFLNVMPNGLTHLKITIDGPNTYQESNEGNNVILLQKLTHLGADLTVGSVVIKDRALHITVRNIGQSDAPRVDLALLWLGVKGGLPEYVTVEPISAGQEMTTPISFDGLGGANKMLNDPPEGAKELRIYIDGNQKLVELNEGNNIAFLNRSDLQAPSLITPPSPTPEAVVTLRPKLKLALSAEVITSKNVVRKTKEAYPGDSVRATLVIKNTDEGTATGLSASLYCPKNTSLKTAELNGKDKKQEATRLIAAPNLGKGASHHLVVVCVIDVTAAKKGQSILNFTGAARFKEETQTLQSNTVKVVVLQPKKEKLPVTSPKVPEPVTSPPQAVEPEPLQAFSRQDLTTDSDFRF